MKIVFVVPDMAGGGTERVISLLANEFVAQGIETAILSFAGNQQAYPLDPRVETVSAGAVSGGKVSVRLRRLRNMRAYFKKNKGCHIFSFSTYGTGFVVLSTLFMKRDMIVSERIDPKSCDHKLYRNFFYLFARTLVCQTRDCVECFPKILQKKATVIGNPVSEDIPSRFTGERKKNVVTAGRLEPQKNHHLLIEAFALFLKEYPDYKLDIYGQGYLEEELRRHAVQSGIEGSVVFHGFCKNMREEIRDSSMFVLSSDYEGLSNSLLEAMAMGLPVISTDCPIGGSRVCIQNDINGLLVPMRDAPALADAMKKIAGDFAYSEKLSQNAELIKDKYKISEIAKRYLELV